MVGLVISDSFLLVGEWNSKLDNHSLKGVVKVDFLERINPHVFNEAGLSSIIASSLRKAQETFSFSGKKVVVGIPDHFVEHSVINIESDLSYNEHMEYIKWIDYQKGRHHDNSVYTFGQTYYPSQENIHICSISRSLIRILKLSIAEMGGNPFWMGPLSSMYIDGRGEKESAVITRKGNKYLFLKLQNNIFEIGTIAFSGGIPRLISSTGDSEDNIFSALGFDQNNENSIPIFCGQKLGRQAKNAWELSDYRSSIPFEKIKLESKIGRLPFYEANILSELITNKAVNFSFNFFGDEGIVEFFFDEVYTDLNELEKDNGKDVKRLEDQKETNDNSVDLEDVAKTKEVSAKDEGEKTKSLTGYAVAVVAIVACFIGFNYLKLQNQINSNFFGFGKNFKIERSGVDSLDKQINNESPPLDLIKESRAISTAIIKLLTQTDLNRYNGLTITKSFLSLEYMSGTNPNIENILGLDPTSFTVEATGSDSTIFLWYYSFELPTAEEYLTEGKIDKIDLMVQLDTSLTDYNLKYFEQVYTRNQIYGPLLLWVKGKSDILSASAIVAKLNDDILLRKFVLFNKTDRPNPKAGFYISILED
ncbi:MAG: hypothetical protein CMG63_03295 [Candidatus Marinimicrobia bacterium]|nr:hypothetical protein [Candidatus Neomarinimicrobiota bacterium]